MSPFKVTSLDPKERVDLKTVVGRSYNVLKNGYVSPENVNISNPILQMDKIETVIVPTRIQKRQVIGGDSLREIAEAFSFSISASASAFMFSASIKSDFKKESESSNEMAYFKLWHLDVKKRESFAGGDEYKKHLNPQFARDLRNLSPDAFFTKYGTHLIKDAWFGGRLEFNFSREKQINETKESLKVDVDAAYGEIASVKTSTSLSKKAKDIFSNSNINAQVVGGTSISAYTEETFIEEYKKWTSSLSSEKNWDFCGIPNENALIPLWELSSDSSRREILKEHYRKLAKSTGNMLEEKELFVKDIQFVNHSNATQARRSRPSGYILVDKDLNSGASGDYIYMCYKLGEGRSGAITNCVIDETKKSMRPSEGIGWKTKGVEAKYYRDGMDLNKGAKGNYIYLYYTKDRKFTPIKRMTVIFDDERISEDWEVVRWARGGQAGDCNKSVGGKYIYIYVNRAKETD